MARARDERGIVVIIVAATVAALLVVVSIVVNLGGARNAKANDQTAADAAALAGAARTSASLTDNSPACKAAWASLVSNLGVSAVNVPNCALMNGTCNPANAREVVTTSGAYVVTLVNPVPDTYSYFTGQPAETADGLPCDRFGVKIQQTWNYLITNGTTSISAGALSMRVHTTGDIDAPLVVLSPHGCEVLAVSGTAHMEIQTASGAPGYIAVDSDGTSCASGNKVIVDTSGGGHIDAGAISMWALTTGNVAKAYDPADVGVDRGFYPAPIASSSPVGRTSMDWRYNCLPANGCLDSTPSSIQNLITADGGPGVPTGFVRWTSVYSCSASGDIVVPRGNWYIDCPSGLTTGGSLTFRGGDIVSDAGINLNGSGVLRINCDVASLATACPSNPTTVSTFYLRSGDLTRNGTLTLLETFVYLANGSVSLGGNTPFTWTAPDDPTTPFDDLLVWTEKASTMPINGNAGMAMEGIFFAPNATLSLGGTTGTGALASQMYVATLDLGGNGVLTLAPREDRSVKLGGTSSGLIR
jgi:Flp pilus assembly protein TadG